jgi:hypothetical protein
LWVKYKSDKMHNWGGFSAEHGINGHFLPRWMAAPQGNHLAGLWVQLDHPLDIHPILWTTLLNWLPAIRHCKIREKALGKHQKKQDSKVEKKNVRQDRWVQQKSERKISTYKRLSYSHNDIAKNNVTRQSSPCWLQASFGSCACTWNLKKVPKVLSWNSLCLN